MECQPRPLSKLSGVHSPLGFPEGALSARRQYNSTGANTGVVARHQRRSSVPGGGDGPVRFFDKAGVLHVHTRYSDGIGTVGRIARAAVRAGVDFVIVTDHDTLAGLHNGDDGWYGRDGRRTEPTEDGAALVIIGYEISPDDGNHLLALGLDEVVSKEQPTAVYVRQVARRGGLGFIAHPVYPPPERYPLKIFPWTAWDVGGFSGMEIWTYTVDWLTDITTWPRLAKALWRPDQFVDGPFPEALKRWDTLCRRAWFRGRRVVGIGSTDAHGILYSYRRMFKTVRTHVLLESDWSGDVDWDKRAVLDALREGRAYVAYDALHDATGFRFEAETSSGPVPMGGVVHRCFGRREGPSRGALTLRVESPVTCTLTLRTPDGVIQRVDGRRLEHRVTASGVYRVEAHLTSTRGLRPWVYTNPIYVR